jgi:hypothetical protein
VDTGLSSGAKAGIGVGVALGVIGLLTFLAGIWMMRRARRRDNEYAPTAMAQEHHQGSPVGYVSTLPTKMATTAGVTSMDGASYNAVTPQSAFQASNPSYFGGSTAQRTPVELSEERPSELPAEYATYSGPNKPHPGHHNGGHWSPGDASSNSGAVEQGHRTQ